MCPTYSEIKFNTAIKAFFVVGDEVEEIELPESWANLLCIDDHSPGTNMLGFLITVDGQEIYVFTNDEAYQEWLQSVGLQSVGLH